MASLRMGKVALSASLRIHPNTFEKFLPASPVRVGEELAEQINSIVTREKLGYYPALEYFREQEGFDKDLLDAADQISWVATSLVREEVQLKLRPVFASLRFEGIQCLAYTMPAVRPGQSNSMQRLAQHYTPDAVKLDIQVNLLRKDLEQDGLEKFAANVASRWLKKSFAIFDITLSRLIPDDISPVE